MRIRILPILVAALAVLVTVPAIASEPSPALIVDGFARAAVGGWGAPAPGLRWVPDGQPAPAGQDPDPLAGEPPGDVGRLRCRQRLHPVVDRDQIDRRVAGQPNTEVGRLLQ